MDTPPPGVELLDDPGADPILVARSLGNLARANRLFGGWLALQYGLGRLLAGVRGDITLLDVGTGAGDLPNVAIRWGLRRGITIRPLGLERSPVAARLARRNGVPTVLGTGAALPFPSRSVDLVLMSQVTHHFSDRDAAGLLRECGRVARCGVILSDLAYAPLAAHAFAIGTRFLGFDTHTRRDGATSLRRGYTRERLLRLLSTAGVDAHVSRRVVVRFVATWATP